jgi:uncharacterized phage-associated protein
MADQLKTLAAANFFLSKGAAEGVPIDPLKLQKLVYFAHGWHLAVTGEPLIDDPVEAWPYGPVIPILYREFKRFGSAPITQLAYATGPSGEFYPPLPTDALTISVLEKVWEQYGRYSAVQLSNLSHEPGSPWEVAKGKGQGGKLRNEDIHRFFFETSLSHRAKAGDA